jgi:hypothetical protein
MMHIRILGPFQVEEGGRRITKTLTDRNDAVTPPFYPQK